MAPSRHDPNLSYHSRAAQAPFRQTRIIAAEQKGPWLSSEISAATSSVAEEALLQEVSTLIRCPEPCGQSLGRAELGTPPGSRAPETSVA